MIVVMQTSPKEGQLKDHTVLQHQWIRVSQFLLLNNTCVKIAEAIILYLYFFLSCARRLQLISYLVH